MNLSLSAAYDAAFFDLDGVIYLGPVAVPGAAACTDRLAKSGVTLMYVTNNAARSAQAVVDHLNSLGFAAGIDNVLTSAQVAAKYLAAELPADTKILVTGTENLRTLIAQTGLQPVESADAQPVAVLLGYDPQMTYPRLDEAALAIGRGVKWYACNDDKSRPTDRGIVLGVGGMIAAIHAATGKMPVTFGKPFRPMMDEAVRSTGAKRPIFVGDRLDTDIAGANNAQLDSLLVFTGAHGKYDLVNAKAGERPTHIGWDVSALLEPPMKLVRDADNRLRVDIAVDIATDIAITVQVSGDEIECVDVPQSRLEQLAALWGIANLAWESGADTTAALQRLDKLP